MQKINIKVFVLVILFSAPVFSYCMESYQQTDVEKNQAVVNVIFILKKAFEKGEIKFISTIKDYFIKNDFYIKNILGTDNPEISWLDMFWIYFISDISGNQDIRFYQNVWNCFLQTYKNNSGKLDLSKVFLNKSNLPEFKRLFLLFKDLEVEYICILFVRCECFKKGRKKLHVFNWEGPINELDLKELQRSEVGEFKGRELSNFNLDGLKLNRVVVSDLKDSNFGEKLFLTTTLKSRR